jgi:hypothetical protein
MPKLEETQSQKEAPFMRRRDIGVEVENGTILRVKSCVPAPHLDAWESLMAKGEFPCLDFTSEEEAEGFRRKAQERFPVAKISLERPTQWHPVTWTVFAHK